jgi:hypothetical protein
VLQGHTAETFTDSSYTLGLWNETTRRSRKEAKYDLIVIIEEIKRQPADSNRRVIVAKVYSHVLDHKDLKERKRRRDWMQKTYPENSSKETSLRTALLHKAPRVVSTTFHPS